LVLLLSWTFTSAQYTRQDSLRGTDNAERQWWDVRSYQLAISVDIDNRTISGTNKIDYCIENAGSDQVMQIDLQEPMQITKIEDAAGNGSAIPYTREGNVYRLKPGTGESKKGSVHSLVIHFSGKPRTAVNPPWDGGWIFTKDAKGRPWVSVACQGLGASVWYPCKDYQGDEPDSGASLSIEVPDTLVAVANGKQSTTATRANGRATYQWRVLNPINNYNIIPYIGKYVSFSETFAGAKGALNCEYWVLDYDLAKAQQQFGRDVKRMLSCFENWFGPYPFYEDNYKLVEAPHLGMEHQSAVAYGNKFMNGYLGMDLSGTGWGKDWDYIIVHESGHEWFGNNLTTRDIADMWIHEGFTTYSEVLFTECVHGLKAANEYVQGLRSGIANAKPVIGPYGVNQEGSSDMYPKGANLIHTVRQLIGDDAKFRDILRGLNKKFYHSVVSSAIVEKYIATQSGLDLSKIFDQYLRNTAVPVFEYRFEGKKLYYRWSATIAGFNMPLKVTIGAAAQWLKPTNDWQEKQIDKTSDSTLVPDPNFYIITRHAREPAKL